MILEKGQATQKIVCKVQSNEQEITDLSKINTHIYQFYQHLYSEKQKTSEDSICDFLDDLPFGMTLRTHLSIRWKNQNKYLRISQRQAFIKLLEKPNKDKRYIGNCRSTSLLKVDLKIILKSLKVH